MTIARRYVREQSVAEDLVTDAFVSFWEKRNDFSEKDNIPAWIFTVVKNKCLNHLIAQKRQAEIRQDMAQTQLKLIELNISSLKGCDPEQLFSTEMRDMVRRALEQMEPLTKKVFLKSRLEEKSYAEIAAELGISPRRVTSEIQRSLAAMRIAFGDYLPLALAAIVLFS